jgi:hypothetical protein
MRVQLRCATLPVPLGAVAAHYWFNVLDPVCGRCERWEVWQRRNAGGFAFGHLHCNLKRPDEGVGGGPAVLVQEWNGEVAARLESVLKESARTYPFRERYLPWPGPNSNTFVAWVLRRAGLDLSVLSWKALGKGFA